MTKNAVVLAIALAFITSIALSGCNRTSNLTELEHIQRAKDFEAQGEFNAGIIELKNAVLKNAGSAEARLLLGRLYLKTRDGKSAEKELRRAQEAGVKFETLAPLLGDALLLQGEYAKVIEGIEPTEHSSTTNRAQILRIRGDAQFARRQFKDACALYAQALELDNRHVPIYWGLANCAYGKRDTALVKSWLDKAVQLEPGNAASWTRLGDYYRLQNSYKEAEGALTNAVKAAPKDASAYINRAGARLALNDEKGAMEDVNAAQKISPKDPLVRYMQALFDYRAGNLVKARNGLEVVNRAMPQHFQTNLLLGFISYRLGNFVNTETYLSRILRAAPASEDVRLTLASAQLHLGRPQQALETMQPFLREEQKNPKVLAQAGDIYMSLQQFSKAQTYYRSAIEAEPKNAAIRTQLARSQLALGDVDRAIVELQQVARIEVNPSSADTLLIMSWLSKGNFDQALAAIDSLEKKNTKNPQAHNLRGLAYLGKKDAEKAEAEFRRALELQPTFAPAAENLANLKLRQGKPAEASRVYSQLLEHNPKSLEAMVALADLARFAKHAEESLAWLNKAVKVDPTAIPPRQRLVAQYLAANDMDKALVVASEITAKHPEDVDALHLLAQAHLAKHDFQNAIAAYSRITVLRPRLPGAFLELANAQMDAGNPPAARESLQRVLELDPRNLGAKVALILVEAAEGKVDAALKRAAEMQLLYPNEAAGFILTGDLLMNKSRYTEAAANYEKAYALVKSGPVAMSWYRALRSAGKGAQAISPLADWVNRTPSDDTSRLFLATAYRNAGRMQDAQRQFDYLLSKDANNAMVLNEMAIAYQLQKDPQALSFAERAYKQRPAPAIADTLAMILLEKSDKQRALEILEKAIGSKTTNPEIRYHYAVALAQNGKNVKARQTLQELLAANKPFPQAAEARVLLARLK